MEVSVYQKDVSAQYKCDWDHLAKHKNPRLREGNRTRIQYDSKQKQAVGQGKVSTDLVLQSWQMPEQ